jgi:hypothetical protein
MLKTCSILNGIIIFVFNASVLTDFDKIDYIILGYSSSFHMLKPFFATGSTTSKHYKPPLKVAKTDFKIIISPRFVV